MMKHATTALALFFSMAGGAGVFKLAATPAGGDCRLTWKSVLGFVIADCAGDCSTYPNGMTSCALRVITTDGSDVQEHFCICKNLESGQWVDINQVCSGKVKVNFRTGQVTGTTTCILNNPPSCPGGQTPEKKCKPQTPPTGNTPASYVCKCDNV